MARPACFASALVICASVAASPAATGRAQDAPRLVVQRHLAGCMEPVISADGSTMACNTQSRVLVFETTEGLITHTFRFAAPRALSADGSLLLAESSVGGGMVLVDLRSGRDQVFPERAFLTRGTFSPDGALVAYEARSPNRIVVRETRTGNQVAALPGSAPLVFTQPHELVTLALDETQLLVHDPRTGRLLRTLPHGASGEGDRLHSLAASPDGTSLVAGYLGGSFSWLDALSGDMLGSFRGSGAFVVVADDRAGGWHVGGGVISAFGRDGVTEVGRYTGGPNAVSASGLLVTAPDWRRPVERRVQPTLVPWDVRSGRPLRRWPRGAPSVGKATLSADGSTLATSNPEDGVHVWSLERLAVHRHVSGHHQRTVALSAGGTTVAAYRGWEPFAVDVHDVRTGARRLHLPIEEAQGSVPLHIWRLWLSDDGSRLLVWNERELRTIDVDSGEIVERVRGMAGSDYGRSTAISRGAAYRASPATTRGPDGSHGAVVVVDRSALPGDERTRVWSGTPGSEARALTVTPDDRFLALSTKSQQPGQAPVYRTGVVDVHRQEQVGPLLTTESEITALALALDGRLLAHGDQDGRIVVREVRSGRTLAESRHEDSINAVRLVPDRPIVVSSAQYEETRVWNYETGHAASLLTSGEDWVVFTEDGYFAASRNGGRLVAAGGGRRAFPIEQLAARNNRPDIILSRLGLGSPELLEHYRARHRRRLRRLGLDERSLRASMADAPVATITGAAVRGDEVALTIDLDASAGLARYQVWVDGVPLLGPLGEVVSGRQARREARVALLNGHNRIEVSAIDRAGRESMRDVRTFPHDLEAPGDLYFLGFGVSRYARSELDLEYAHKDALDLAHYFQNGARGFANVHVRAYVDEEVTTQAIGESAAFLESARPNDTVVLFVAGHGLWSSGADATYHFLTHDSDPARLEETAADFELVELLLQRTAARRKLFLMDTCESGERDPEDAAPAAPAEGARALRPRTVRGIAEVNEGSAATRPRPYLFDRQRFLYNDLARRSGAIVLSSSQGTEFSYELDELENGAFTEAILRALTTTEGDADGDGAVDPTELRVYVARTVAALTGDRQHPTVDRDNLLAHVSLPTSPGLEFPASYPRSSRHQAAPPPREVPPQVEPGSRGCSCRVGSSAGPGTLALVPALLLAVLTRRRR